MISRTSAHDMGIAALGYAALGYAVLPCARGGKVPAIPAAHAPGSACRGDCGRDGHGLWDATTDPDRIRAWWKRFPGANIGLAAFRFSAVDIDTKNGHDGHDSWARLCEDSGILVPDAWHQDTPSGGRHYLFRHVPSLCNRASAGGTTYPGLDVRSTNGYILAAPSVVDGRPYVASVEDLPRPEELSELPAALLAALQREDRPRRGTAALVVGPADGTLSTYGRAAMRGLLSKARAAPPGTRNDTWCKVATRAGSLAAAGHFDRYYAVAELCAEADRCGDDAHKTHDTIRRGIDYGFGDTMVAPTVNVNGEPVAASTRSATVALKVASVAEVDAEPSAHDVPRNDMGLAARFLDDHAGDLRYTRALGWFVWSGRHWERDERGVVTERMKATADAIRGEAEGDPDATTEAKRWATRSGDRRRIADAIELAASDPRVRISSDAFDTCAWLLNVGNGTVDLRTGTVREHRREDMISKLAPVAFVPTASAERWRRFLEEAQPDADVRDYLQRWAGYCATGVTREQVFHIHHGGGSNGKGTMEHVLRHVLGDYAGVAAFDTFLARRPGQPTNDLAALPGKRFVVASEPEEGARLSESTVKLVTGEDPLTARFLHREWFTFVPTFKLLLTGNHRPRIRGADHAIWRRVRLVPWSVRFEGLGVNSNLRSELVAEAEGVLAWIVAGAVMYCREGLNPPACVLAATGDYRAAEDVLRRFVEDACVPEALAAVTNRELRDAYRAWCEREGEHPLSAKALADRLRDAGFEPVKDKHGIRGRGWIGLRLLTGGAA